MKCGQFLEDFPLNKVPRIHRWAVRKAMKKPDGWLLVRRVIMAGAYPKCKDYGKTCLKDGKPKLEK